MSCVVRLERSGAFKLTLDFDGPLELASALLEVVSRYEAGLGVEAPTAPKSVPATATDDEARRERERVKKANQRAAKRDMSPRVPTTVPGTEGDMSPGQSQGHALSLLVSSPVSLEKSGENKSERTERETRASGDMSPGQSPGQAGTFTVSPAVPLNVDAPLPGDMRALALGLLQAKAPGRTVDLALEWSKFMAHVAIRRERGERAHASSSEWRAWVLRSVEFARTSTARGRGRNSIVQGGPLSGPQMDFDSPEDFPMPEPETAAQ